MELELKYALPQEVAMETVFNFCRGQGWLCDEVRAVPMEAVYYDTAKGTLASQGVALRVRREGEQVVLTLKTRGPGKDRGALSCRGEWNIPQEPGEPDIKALSTLSLRDDSLRIAWGSLEVEVMRQGLLPLCFTRFTRHVAHLQVGILVAELCVDDGSLGAGQTTAPLREVEVELKEGDTEDLLSVGEKLASALCLAPEERSKFARARAMVK